MQVFIILSLFYHTENDYLLNALVCFIYNQSPILLLVTILEIGRKQEGKQSRNINVLKPHASTTDMQKGLSKNIK